MRVSNSGFINSIKRTLGSQSERIGNLYGQLSSGKRLQHLADDPSAMVRAVRAHATLNELSARQTVAQQAQQLVGATDSALGEVSSLLSEAKDVCLQAGNSSLNDDERSALAAQVRALQSSLVRIGNTEVQGHYIFSGAQTTTPALEEDETANLPVLYHGDHQELAYQIGTGEAISVGFTGAEVFNYPDASGTRPVAAAGEDAFSLLTDLADAVERGDTAQMEQLGSALDKLHAHAVDLRGQVGVVAKRWQRVQDNAASTSIMMTQLLSDDESVDTTAAIVDLSNLETAYAAALSITSRMLQLPGLLDE